MLMRVIGSADMRFQVLMPDVLHWLGVKKIDNVSFATGDSGAFHS